MKPIDYAKIAAALGISMSEAAELEAEWRNWRVLQIDKEDEHEPIHARYAQN